MLSAFFRKLFHYVADSRPNPSSRAALLAFHSSAGCFPAFAAPTHAALFVHAKQRPNVMQLHTNCFNAAITAEALLIRLVE